MFGLSELAPIIPNHGNKSKIANRQSKTNPRSEIVNLQFRGVSKLRRFDCNENDVTDEWRRATESGDRKSIEVLLDAGADIDSRDHHGQTALMNAAHAGQTVVVDLLIRRGASLDHHAKYGLTAVMLAVIADHTDVVQLLVRAGASLTQRGTGAPGFHEKTALDLARARGNTQIISLLESGK